MKHSILLAIFVIFILGCKPQNTTLSTIYTQLQGSTMGTYYSIKYDSSVDYQSSIDSLLVVFNNQLSTYIESSLISRFNQKEEIFFIEEEGKYLLDNVNIAKTLYQASDHSFDPTVMPLVNYWGFGYTGRDKITQVDTIEINKRMPFVGFDQVVLSDSAGIVHLSKSRSGVELDFSASAKGYGVDMVADWLKTKGMVNFMVDIGGEQVLQGVNPKGEPWSIGLNQTTENAEYTDVAMIIQASNVALASSGNYRNFYEVNGNKYSHTINPMTGFPERSNLLGVTIIADKCVLADAYATTCMVKGLDKGFEFIENLPDVEAVFFYNEEEVLKTKMTSKFIKFVKNN